MPDRKPRAPRPVKAWAVELPSGRLAHAPGLPPWLWPSKSAAEEYCNQRERPIRVLIVPEPRDE